MYSYIKSSKDQITELYFSSVLPEPSCLLKSVRVFVFNKKKHLLLIKKMDGRWDLPGGQHTKGETFEETATREVYEESNVKIKKLKWMAYEKITKFEENACKLAKRNSFRDPIKSITFTQYGFAFVDEIDHFILSSESISRFFFPVEEAIKQDGILYKNRHIIFEKIYNSL
ncbi:NUDIX hydrolase [Dyadobacter frigoris]|uniref:NUDIX domain-containing protein n=1 Tax=Dyadobacter frigoris TaxID=2576211 RepID=A0A4U6DAI9_9BACT|nr:NUDIX domain-containing protein [Dyadobacter frigoris]TKT93317.1 NUDIX domain-containing protein [Dyadobacter frigoris]